VSVSGREGETDEGTSFLRERVYVVRVCSHAVCDRVRMLAREETGGTDQGRPGGRALSLCLCVRRRGEMWKGITRKRVER